MATMVLHHIKNPWNKNPPTFFFARHAAALAATRFRPGPARPGHRRYSVKNSSWVDDWKIHIIYCQRVYVSLYIILYIYVCVCTFLKPPQQQKTEKQWTTSESLKFGAGPFGSCLRHQRPNFSCSPSSFNPGWPKGQVFLAKCLSSVNPSVTIPSAALSIFIGRKCKTRQKNTYEA